VLLSNIQFSSLEFILFLKGVDLAFWPFNSWAGSFESAGQVLPLAEEVPSRFAVGG
jgi:hypothetical protein